MKADEPRHSLTQADVERLVERHVEIMKYRKLEEDYSLFHAVKASQILARTNQR